MEDGGVVLMDLLWSDPTTNDGVEGVQPSPRGPGLVTFGPDRVREFCRVRFELFEHFRITWDIDGVTVSFYMVLSIGNVRASWAEWPSTIASVHQSCTE